ncbi:hypothetical protein V8C35DRAFT_104555 [Trichoderma chlorosporum]
MTKPTDGNGITTPEGETSKRPTSAALVQHTNNGNTEYYLIPLHNDVCESGADSGHQNTKIPPQNSKPTISEIENVGNKRKGAAGHDFDSDYHSVLYPTPCMCCAFGLAEGNPRYLCRRDYFPKEDRCIECILAKKRCTWLRFNPSPDKCLDLLNHRKLACTLLHKNGQKAGQSSETWLALNDMMGYAQSYLLAMWENANLGELFALECHRDYTQRKKMKKMKRDAKRKQAVGYKDTATQAAPFEKTPSEASHANALLELKRC